MAHPLDDIEQEEFTLTAVQPQSLTGAPTPKSGVGRGHVRDLLNHSKKHGHNKTSKSGSKVFDGPSQVKNCNTLSPMAKQKHAIKHSLKVSNQNSTTSSGSDDDDVRL